MADVEQLVLSLITGVGFGYIVYRLGSSPQRLAVILFALWMLMSGSQHLYRALDGVDVAQEVVVLASLRLAFALAAVFTVAFFNERHMRRQR